MLKDDKNFNTLPKLNFISYHFPVSDGRVKIFVYILVENPVKP